MKIYKNTTVLEESLNRIRFLFDEFEEVVGGFSGGKDSTVVLNLALQVAEEKNRLPLKVFWIDQEAEWQHTVDYCEKVFSDPRVEPMWFQIPMVWYDNVSFKKDKIYIWKEGDKWIRPKSEKSIKENIYLDFGFHELFERIFRVHFKQSACYLSGVRTQESPKRFMSLTSALTYKTITWGKVLNKNLKHYTFYPIS